MFTPPIAGPAPAFSPKCCQTDLFKNANRVLLTVLQRLRITPKNKAQIPSCGLQGLGGCGFSMSPSSASISLAPPNSATFVFSLSLQRAKMGHLRTLAHLVLTTWLSVDFFAQVSAQQGLPTHPSSLPPLFSPSCGAVLSVISNGSGLG